jgi:hypothetical protein
MDTICSICLEDIINISDKLTLSCEHFYHKDCINKYMNTFCPLCKTSLIKSNIYYVNTTNDYNFKNIVLLTNKLNEKLLSYFNLTERILFLQLLNKNVVLSGSFILSIILNEFYDSQDLDIFIDNYSDYKILKKFLKDCKYKKNNEYYINNHKYSDNYNGNQINKVLTFNKNNRKIDIIFNKNNYILFKYNTDLDILKNYYDGKYFYIYDKTKLELKIDYISKSKLTQSIINRIIKYRQRGFQIYIVE